MSFFKKLFGKKKNVEKKSEPIKTNSDSNQSNANGAFNNFQEYGFPNIQFGLMGNQGMDVMATIGRLDKEMKSNNLPFEVKGFYYTKLLEEGALKIPVVFKSENKGYSLFYIYDEEQAKAFNSSKDLISDTEFPNALYISTIDCEKITAKSNGLTSFNLSDLSYNEKPELKGDYGMWWSESSDNVFHTSKSKESLDEIFECVKGYESYMFGYLLSEIKMKGFEEFQRVGLPADEKNFVIKGPEYLDIVISASQEKGIRFQFPKEIASYQYRERFLKQIQSSLQAFQVILMMQQAPKDEETDENGYDWYKFMTRVIEKKEKEGEINGDFVIGGISFN